MVAKSGQTQVQIAFQSNPSRYRFAGESKLINAYAEQQGSDAKAPLAVLPCPGMKLAGNVTDTPGRGLIFCEDLDVLFSVHSTGVFRVNKTSDDPFTLMATNIGVVPGVDQVQLSRNQANPVQVSIHTAQGEYYIEANTVKQVTDDDITEANIVSQGNVDGYTLYLDATGKFFWSDINNCNSVDTLNFATAEQSADGGTRVKSNGSDIFFFGVQTIEPWRVVSDINLPFELIGGAVQQRGMVAPLAVVESDNTLMFPGEDNIFYRLNSYAPQRISTHAQERLLESEPSRETVQGFPYVFQGHSFSTWTGTNWTTGFDAATQTWHNRESYNLKTWRARNGVRAWGKTIVQDALTGNLYSLDADTFTEDDEPMIWGMDCPILHATGSGGGIVDSLYIDVLTGVGALDSTAQGFDPILMLEWSTDGGSTFTGKRQLKLGKRGNTRKRIKTYRLGRFEDKGIMFRVRISDQVPRCIVSMTANIRPLAI